MIRSNNPFCFKKNYFVLTILLLGIEILIGEYLQDAIIRPYGGDFLVVILLYCLARTFLKIPKGVAAISVLIFSYIIETLQYFKLADRLGLLPGSLGRTLLGDYFTWMDILSYTLGILTVIGVEYLYQISIRD